MEKEEVWFLSHQHRQEENFIPEIRACAKVLKLDNPIQKAIII